MRRWLVAALVVIAGLLLMPLAVAAAANAADGSCGDICPIASPATLPPATEPPPATIGPPLITGPPRQPVHTTIRHPIVRGPGHDVRPCVSTREFRGAKAGTTKRELEQRWEVVGLGRRLSVAFVGSAWIYPRCGGGDLRYGAVYDRGRLYATVAYSDAA